MPTPLFLTHHSPVGAWSSLTFGLPSRGVSIDHERTTIADDADFLIAVSRQDSLRALPFITDPAHFPGYSFINPANIERTLTPCIDQYASPPDGLTLRVYTPPIALPNPRRSGNLQFATAPAILLELEIDNSTSDAPAQGFLGLRLRGPESLRPVDWSSKALCGVALASRWLLGAHAVKNEVYTLRDSSVRGHLRAAQPFIRLLGNEGGIAFNVPAGGRRTLTAVFAFHHAGTVTQGLDTRYLYTNYFPKLESAANFVLQNAQKIRESSASFDRRCQSDCPDPARLELFSQALHAYQANTQITEADGNVYFTVIEGDRGWRNALDSTVDHLAWELGRNPWVVRNIFDLFTSTYAYQDQITIPDAQDPAAPASPCDGGMALTRDMGALTAYSPAGQSASEMPDGSGGCSCSATEQILNGIYLLTSYALTADDAPWSRTRLPFARELLMSLENRDHSDPAQRNGIPKARSTRCGNGLEVASCGEFDSVLGDSSGSLCTTMKTFAANLMLTTYFQGHNDLHSADYSYAFAQKTAQSLIAAFDSSAALLPANLLKPDTSPAAPRVLACLASLAVPTHLGLTSTLAEYFPELFNVLKQHALTCLKACIDPVTGGLRLSSTSSIIAPSTVIAVLYVLEHLFQIDAGAEYPGIWRELLHWTQVSAAGTTIADRVDAAERRVLGATNHPGLITAALFLHSASS